MFFYFVLLGEFFWLAQNLFKAGHSEIQAWRNRFKTPTWLLGEDTWLKT
jgi:hypothetical protein